MEKARYTSLYLPTNLKAQLVEIAESEGYSVGQGRQSQLAKFVESLLHERILLASENSETSPFSSLHPELRSSVFKLSELDAVQQQYVGSILNVLLEAWSNSSK
jgi:hypothetical protein